MDAELLKKIHKLCSGDVSKMYDYLFIGYSAKHLIPEILDRDYDSTNELLCDYAAQADIVAHSRMSRTFGPLQQKEFKLFINGHEIGANLNEPNEPNGPFSLIYYTGKRNAKAIEIITKIPVIWVTKAFIRAPDVRVIDDSFLEPR